MYSNNLCNLIYSNLRYATDQRLSIASFNSKGIYKVIQHNYQRKAHGHCNIGIRIIEYAMTLLCKPLEIMFEPALLTGTFSSEWRNVNIVPFHKKCEKRNLNNYHLVLLLSICGRI